MRTRWLLLPLSLFPLFLASCGNTGTGGPPPGGSGPFDANGNYVESWADSPSKWKKGGSSGSNASPDQAEIVALQAPLMGSGRSGSSRGYPSAPVTPVSQPPITVRPPTTIASNQPKPRPQVRHDDDEEDRPKPKSKAAVAQNTTKNSKGKTQVAQNTKSKTTTKESSKTTKGSTAKNTTKPKPVLVKPKPTSSRYAVRQGDSLYAIAKRYGTTASAIQKANGMSGTTIRPGQSLTIPKK